ncbi:hypothetical protein ABFV54_28420, partial [Pseudomonas syringae]
GGGEAVLDLTFVLNVLLALVQESLNISLSSGAAYNVTNHQPMRLVILPRMRLVLATDAADQG